jgi:predicted signal transduction protein with EAL and GGDEF domain
VAERARRLVSAVSLERGAAPVTITVGVALYPDHGDTKDAIIASADAAMYAGKQAGGDRVRVPGEAAPAPRRKAAKRRDPDHAVVPRRRRTDAPSPRTTAA